MPTFTELGLPFPLYRASVDEAPEYFEHGYCVVCRQDGPHRFELGIGDDLIVTCGACDSENALSAYEKQTKPCARCSVPILFPPIPDGSPVAACYSCLRAGRGAMTHSMTLGMVTWEHARDGWTHGTPYLDENAALAVRPSADDPEWLEARVASEHLLDLVRTPSFHTWQEENWFFCCKRPSIYLGEWTPEAFAAHDAAEGGLSAFLSLVAGAHPGAWERMSSPDLGGPYMFQCPACGRISGYYDYS